MKTTRIAALALAGLLIVVAAATPAKAADVSFGFFYSNLSPHGSWMVSGSYGNVWQPRVYRADWNPYYDGHWVYTDIGWTWVSDYAWGAVPYHYGTWVVDPRLGWVWVPGYVWGPSWVAFRYGPDYIGWAPVPPSYSIGMSFSSYSIPSSQFVFVPSGAFVGERVRTVVIPRTQTNVIINKTRIVNNNITIQNNVVVNRGPDVRVIERSAGRRIAPVSIERVRNVAPSGTVTRDAIRVDPQRVQGRRVAEPVKGSLEQARTRAPESRRALPDDRNVSGRRDRNRPSETSTAPRRPQPQTTQPDTLKSHIRKRAIPENPPQPQEPPRARPERPMPPGPEKPPRVNPQEPPRDPNTSDARKPVQQPPQDKSRPTEKGKPVQKGKPPVKPKPEEAGEK